MRDAPEGSMCIVLFRVLPLPPFPSFLPQTTENAEVPLPRPPGLWVPVSTTPAGPWDRKATETCGNPAKKLHLDEIYRSVPAMPPGTDREPIIQKRITPKMMTFFTFQS